MKYLETKFRNSAFYYNDNTKNLLGVSHIFNEIYSKCGYKIRKGAGTYLFGGQTYVYDISMHPKQKLLFDIAKNTREVLEIGT